MKIALCLYGQPRHVENLKVYRSHLEWIISKYQTDVFCHTWYKKNYEYIPSTWNSLPPTIANDNVIQIITDMYKPVKILVQEPIDTFDTSCLNDPLFMKQEFLHNSVNKNNILSQLYSINKVASLLDNYISTTNTHYDFIIMARYDLVVNEFPDMTKLDKSFFYTMNTHPRFPDLFFIFNPMFMKSQFVYDNLNTALETMKKYSDKFWECSLECIKFNVFCMFYDKSLIRGVQIREVRNVG